MEKMMLNNELVEIDDLCVPFIKFFNERGLRTEFCCEGHSDGDEFHIIFHESVTDEMIHEFEKRHFLSLLDDSPFYRWDRHIPVYDYDDDSFDLFKPIRIDYYSNWVFIIKRTNWTHLEYAGDKVWEANTKEEYLNTLYEKFLYEEEKLLKM